MSSAHGTVPEPARDPDLAVDLAAGTLRQVVDGTGAREVLGPDGGPFLATAAAEGEPSGVLRVFRSDDGLHVVATVLSVPARGVVTCMVFAFTPPGSALPHFTLDCANRGDGYAFHLDVLPRVELASHLDYLDEVYGPLTSWYERGCAVDGLAPTGTTRRQHALMSPWMLVHLADEPAFRAIAPVVAGYADVWLERVRAGLPDAVAATLADTDLAARDAAVRANLFSPSVDPVWGRVTAMVGEQAASVIRGQLLGSTPD